MKVEVFTEITILDGSRKGEVLTDKRVMETLTDFTSPELLQYERLRLEWTFIPDKEDNYDNV